jgi:putative methyltransferase
MTEARHRIYLGNFTSEISFYLPYTSGALRAYAETDPRVRERCEFPRFIFHSLNGVEAVAAGIENPSVLGLSLYVWNEERSLKLARLVKRKFPGCLVVFGGPQVPLQAQDWMEVNPHVDLLVHHEGEAPFLEILRRVVDGRREWSGIPGVTYRTESGIARDLPAASLPSLAGIESPYLKGFLDDCIEEAASLGRSPAAVIETNRGCPYSCTFCDWGNNAFDRIRKFDDQKVMSEIRFLGRKIGEIYAADANFGILPRDVEIAQELAAQADLQGKVHTIQVIMAKQKTERTERIAEILNSRRLTLLGETVGVQTLTPQVLDNVKRRNISYRNLTSLFERYRSMGIPSYVELILGLPGETKESFLKSLEEVLSAKAPDIRVYNLSLLPNSELAHPAQREKFGLKTRKTKIIEGSEGESEFSETVIATRDLSFDDYKYLRELAMFVDVLHGGKWFYYVAWYLKKRLGVEMTSFYAELLEHARRPENSASALGKLQGNWYLRERNGGFFNRFEGPYSPHGVDWSKKFFFKQTYNWLCISEERGSLFESLRSFLRRRYPAASPQELQDLVSFQSAIMYAPEDGHVAREIHSAYDWTEFFEGDGELKARPTRRRLSTRTVGRHSTPVRGDSKLWIFEAAGGAYFDKIERFTHPLR